SKTGISFTEDGKVILEHAQKILKQHEHIEQYLQEKYNKNYAQGKLLLGAGPVINETLLPDLLFRMHSKFPNISIHVAGNSVDTIINLLQNKELDFILFSYSEKNRFDFRNINFNTLDNELEAYHTKKLYVDPIVCIMPNNHPLSLQETVTTDDMNSYKQTAFSNDTSYITSKGFLHVSTNIKIHQQFIKSEGTICCLPLRTYQAMFPPKEFTCKFITDAPPIHVYLICRKDMLQEKNALYQDFINTAVSLCQYG
ncbi:MAG: LysR family transcriptional regulator substrate-binding protein, partial [Peptococcaceae bacterium]|nr:LysR family transcriptional regulator substrate-binding protein [Peptococcaceae bacterium]